MPTTAWACRSSSSLAFGPNASLQVVVWEATNPVDRDFRLATFGANWASSVLTEQGAGEFVATITPPLTGATAHMIELTYLVGGVPLTFTTDVSVVQISEPTTSTLVLSGMVTSLLFSRRHQQRRRRLNGR